MTFPHLDKMAPVLGDNVIGIFKLMGVSEEEIDAAIKDYPEYREKIHDSFCLCCPRMELFATRSPELYRHHVRELIARHLAGEDTRPGTKAEILAALSETSFASTLIESAHLLMERLTKEVFPEYEQPDGWEPQEPWPQALEDTLAKCRLQLIDDQRTVEQKRSHRNG